MQIHFVLNSSCSVQSCIWLKFEQLTCHWHWVRWPPGPLTVIFNSHHCTFCSSTLTLSVQYWSSALILKPCKLAWTLTDPRQPLPNAQMSLRFPLGVSFHKLPLLLRAPVNKQFIFQMEITNRSEEKKQKNILVHRPSRQKNSHTQNFTLLRTLQKGLLQYNEIFPVYVLFLFVACFLECISNGHHWKKMLFGIYLLA